MESEYTEDSLASRAAKLLMRLKLSHSQTTKAGLEVPLLFRENCLVAGYRVPGKSWAYYFRSILHVHNESGNVWSHFIALFIFIYKVYELCTALDVTQEPLTWPILGFSLGIIIYAVLSTFAHLCHSKSPLIHYTCFQIDYIGIGLNGFGTACLLYYMTGSKSYYAVITPTFFMVVNTLIAVTVCIMCSVAKLRYSRPYPPQRKYWQFASVGGHVIFGMIPLLCFLQTCMDDKDCSVSHIFPHIHAFLWFFLSVFFFASGMPERFSPGRFDIVGHGHQIFHVLMIVTSLLQFHAGVLEIRRRPRDLVAMSAPDATVIFGSIFTVILLDAIFIIYTHKHRVAKVALDVIHEREFTKNIVNKCK